MKQTLSIIKIGGNIIDNEAALKAFCKDFAALPGLKLLVHGGGKLATEMGNKLGIPSQIVDGRRITDAETLKIVTMVYGGLINKNIVALLQSHYCNAIGLCGADGNILPALKRSHPEIDYGFVGDIKTDKVNINILNQLFSSGLSPVMAPLTHDTHGQLLNTNADTIASVLAVSLASDYKVNLIYCFEKNGVLSNANDDNSVISELNHENYAILKAQGIISKGMIPKLDNAFEALRKGVNKVIIGHADSLQDLAGETTQKGTMLIN